MSTKRISTLILLAVLLLIGQGCANRKQMAVDKSMLIQENLQLDQALSIAQYELMLAQEENEALRRQLGQPGPGGRSRANGSGGSLPPLRSGYEPMSNGINDAPAFDANDGMLPPPTNQMPQHFLSPQGQQPNIAPPQPGIMPGQPQQNPQGQGQSYIRLRTRPVQQAAYSNPSQQNQYGHIQQAADRQQFGSMSPVVHASDVSYVEVPADAPRWSPQRSY